MEKVRPWCGQPSDRGRPMNRTEQCSTCQSERIELLEPVSWYVFRCVNSRCGSLIGSHVCVLCAGEVLRVEVKENPHAYASPQPHQSLVTHTANHSPPPPSFSADSNTSPAHTRVGCSSVHLLNISCKLAQSLMLFPMVLVEVIANKSAPIQLAQCQFPGWPFPMLKYKYISQIKYTEAVWSNSTQKLLWFEICKMLIVTWKRNFIVSFIIIIGTR